MNKKIISFTATALIGLMSAATGYAESLRPINFELNNERHTGDLAIHFNSTGAYLIGSTIDERKGDFSATLVPSPDYEKGKVEIFFGTRANPANRCLFTAALLKNRAEVSMVSQGEAICWVNQEVGRYRLHVYFPEKGA